MSFLTACLCCCCHCRHFITSSACNGKTMNNVYLVVSEALVGVCVDGVLRDLVPTNSPWPWTWLHFTLDTNGHSSTQLLSQLTSGNWPILSFILIVMRGRFDDVLYICVFVSTFSEVCHCVPSPQTFNIMLCVYQCEGQFNLCFLFVSFEHNRRLVPKKLIEIWQLTLLTYLRWIIL